MNINICKTGNPFKAKRILIKVYHFRRVLSTELIWSLVNLIKTKHNSSRRPIHETKTWLNLQSQEVENQDNSNPKPFRLMKKKNDNKTIIIYSKHSHKLLP